LREDLERYVEGHEVPLASRSSKLRAVARKSRYTLRRHPIAASIVGALLIGGFGALAIPRHDPGDPTPFYRISNGELIRLSTNELKVYPGDFLGKEVSSVGKSYVYTLSVFGAEPGKQYVYPYRTALRDQLERLGKSVGPWGLEIDESVDKVVCTQIDTDCKNKFEGLLVLQTRSEFDEFEQWMYELETEGTRTKIGVPYEEAIRRLERQFTPVRGVRKAGELDAATLDGVRRALADDEVRQAKKKLDLPGVEEFAIECEVAGS
jgi:hypothetical protein